MNSGKDVVALAQTYPAILLAYLFGSQVQVAPAP